MADLVQNPFDTQQKSASSSSGSGLIASNMTGGNTYTTQAPAENTVSQFDPVNRSVDPATQTVAGQVDSILAGDSPLMQRARTMATQQMAQRGLVNSSMAVGAGQAAMIDRALPIAQQDANTYNAVASENMAARNQAGVFNAGAQNQSSLQTSQQKFAGAQADLDRAQQLVLSNNSIEAQKQLQVAQQQFAAAQADLDRTQQTNLQNSQQTFQQSMQNDAQVFQQSMTLLQQSFQASQSQLDRNQQIALQNDAQAFQEFMANTQIPVQFATQISSTLSSSVNAIAGDPNLSGTPDGQAPEGSSPKSRAIQSAINYANSQLAWANQFYGTNIAPMPTA